MHCVNADGQPRVKPRWLQPRLLLANTPYLALCTSQKQFDALVRKLDADISRELFVRDGCDGTTHTYERPDYGVACIVCIRKSGNTDAVLQMLVHEAVHVYQQHIRIIGEASPGDEMQAYSIQNVFASLYTEYNRQVKA